MKPAGLDFLFAWGSFPICPPLPIFHNVLNTTQTRHCLCEEFEVLTVRRQLWLTHIQIERPERILRMKKVAVATKGGMELTFEVLYYFWLISKES